MRIPTGNFGNLTPQPQNNRVQVTGTGAVGDAVRHLATVGMGIAGDQQQRIDRENQSQAQALTNQIDQYSTQLLNDPDHGLYALQGTNADGATDRYLAKFDEYASARVNELPEPMRKNFINQVEAKRIQFMRGGLSYENNQRQQVQQGNYSAALANSRTRAEGFWGDNISWQLETGATKQQIADYGAAQGWTAEQVKQEQHSWLIATAFNSAKNAAADDPTGFLQQVGEPSSVGGVQRYAPASGGSALGIRNNNPGNIERSGANAWDGEVNTDGRFAKFATPEHGIRALGKNLLSYNRRGYNTLSQIIERWAPSKEKANNTPAYIAAMSKYVGVPADQPLDLNDVATLARVSAGIIRHENGGNPYTPEQLQRGALAALGMEALQQAAPESGSIRPAGATAAFNALDPLQQAQLRSMAETQLNKQRTAYREQMGTMYADTQAAFDRGEVPDVIPSQRMLIQAYGYSEGQAKYRDLLNGQQFAGYIAAAKNMSPAGQAGLLASVQPNPNEAGYASKIQRWERFGRFIAGNVKIQEKQAAAVRFDASMQHNFPLDPNDSSNQTAADEYYAANVQPRFNLSDDSSLNAVASMTTRSGIMPTQIKSLLNAGATSRDPDVVLPIAKMYGQIFDNNPAAVAELPAGTASYYSKIYDLSRAGMPGDKATETAFNIVYAQDERTKKMIASQLRDKDYLKGRDGAAQSLINSLSSRWIGGPDVMKPGQSNQQYQRDYATLYDANFAASGGDTKLAGQLTNAQIKRTWGISTINGSEEIMRYAPEAVYGVSNGAGNWIAGQWAEEKKALAASSFGGARPDTDLILVPDALTPRDFSYGVMVKQTGSDGIPVYHPYYGSNGGALRFKPEQVSSPMYKEVMEKRAQAVDKARQQRADPDPIDAGIPPPAPLNLSDPFEQNGKLNLNVSADSFPGGQ
ncbi:hypothetical protein [Pantoea sp. BAV 3049]|uniref:hypothetical protein n=1 Tax=Pantoea sp. BAV 3049 TaxID=2654188 RepID=UPI00131AF70B|nr:hypothetical protein [Pantoea sp. BAV 3049]